MVLWIMVHSIDPTYICVVNCAGKHNFHINTGSIGWFVGTTIYGHTHTQILSINQINQFVRKQAACSISSLAINNIAPLPLPWQPRFC